MTSFELDRSDRFLAFARWQDRRPQAVSPTFWVDCVSEVTQFQGLMIESKCVVPYFKKTNSYEMLRGINCCYFCSTTVLLNQLLCRFIKQFVI
jgi:hypothetical protein